MTLCGVWDYGVSFVWLCDVCAYELSVWLCIVCELFCVSWGVFEV